MSKGVSRRDFVGASAAIAATLGTNPTLWARDDDEPREKRWFKGNLHLHNQWSDGKPLPEWAVDWYKSNGYHFICPSDHNIFQTDELRFGGFGFQNQPADLAPFKGETSLWKVISPSPGWPRLTQEFVDQAKEKFGADSVRTITVGDQTYVRMKTFAELERQFVEPGKFLMIPGYEHTCITDDTVHVHVNFINVRDVFPCATSGSAGEVLRRTVDEGLERFDGQEYLFHANHPMWRYYDYSPADVIAVPQIRLFELNNNNIDASFDPHPEGWRPEKFWDVVNAHRASRDQPLLLGLGSDDRHDYTVAPKGWTMVRAARLHPSDLIAAISKGDFYASNGLDFADIQFDGKTLSVKIDPKHEGPHRIQFVGTKKDYDPSSRTINVAKSDRSPARKIDVYSDSIGVVLETAEGVEASYTLKPDDLYVRAKITQANADPAADWESKPAAWTQPYR